MIQVIIIGAFGAVGAIGRFAVSGWVYRACGESFPFGTLAVNLVGCFLLGLIAHLGQTTDWLTVAYRQGITIGLLGALTTFSTFSYETLMQLQAGQWQAAGVNVVSNVVIGLACAWGGLEVGQVLVS